MLGKKKQKNLSVNLKLKYLHHGVEAIYLRLSLESMCWDSNPAKNPVWDSNPCGWDLNSAKTHGLSTKITDRVSGPIEAQVLDVSLQKEFNERQSDR